MGFIIPLVWRTDLIQPFVQTRYNQYRVSRFFRIFWQHTHGWTDRQLSMLGFGMHSLYGTIYGSHGGSLFCTGIKFDASNSISAKKKWASVASVHPSISLCIIPMLKYIYNENGVYHTHTCSARTSSPVGNNSYLIEMIIPGYTDNAITTS